MSRVSGEPENLLQPAKPLPEGARNQRSDHLLVWLHFDFSRADSSAQEAPQVGQDLPVSTCPAPIDNHLESINERQPHEHQNLAFASNQKDLI